MMTHDELTKLIFSRQLVSIMNTTKWKELAHEMTSNSDFNPLTRLKYIDEELPTEGFCHLDWEWVMNNDTRIIEWMEIDSVKQEYVGRLVDSVKFDFSDFVRQSLNKHSIPFEEEGRIFRINGYLMPNKSI